MISFELFGILEQALSDPLLVANDLPYPTLKLRLYNFFFEVSDEYI
jgi:hypothetical protein